MEVDQNTLHPFVFIQYPNPPSRAVQFHTTQSNQPNENRPPPNNNNNNNNNNNDSQPPQKRKRQQNGYACDKCRERRVGCDRRKPTCGQCNGKYKCAYSNESLRLDHVSMRQRMEEMQATLRGMSESVMRMETEYRNQIANLIETNQRQRIQMYNNNNNNSNNNNNNNNSNNNQMVLTLQQRQHDLPLSPPHVSLDSVNISINNNNNNSNHHHNNHHLNNNNNNTNDSDSDSSSSLEAHSELLIYDNHNNPSVIDWATKTGFHVTFDNDITSIHTNITSYEALSEAVRRALQMTYQFNGSPLYMTPSSTNEISINNIPSFSVFERLGRIQAITIKSSTASSSASSSSPFSSTANSSNSDDHQDTTTSTDKLLETDVMTRLIHQHHRCGFPILVSPSRFEQHYQKGELKSVVLSSIFCHIAPHACIYHPHLVHLQDYRALGERFYNHSRDELGLNETPTLSSIHQHTLLITYDLDLGRVRRAFLHLGVAISMCYTLNLHRPDGYVNCTTDFEREQAKRVFWTVWFYDSMVPHFYAQPSTIRQEDIKIELPCVLSDFDPIEVDQTRFAISFIQVRRLRNSEKDLRRFYKSLPESSRYSRLGSLSVENSSFWARRTYYCILLDYCLHWIKLYTPRLPSPLAIRRTSQAAFAMLDLFSHWFRPNEQFDCFFRPYLYHYMSIINVFKSNILEKDGPRSPIIIAQSKAALVKLFHMYRMTPTYRSFAESQLEKDLLIFMQNNEILTFNQLQYGHHQEPDLPSMVELFDDPEADFCWGIFSIIKDQDVNSMNSSSSGSSCSSIENENYASDPVKNIKLDYY